MRDVTDQGLRRNAIRELLESGPVADQKSLVDALSRRGLAATQSSVSRDLRELGAIKTPLGYALSEAPAEGDAELRAVESFVRDVRPAGPNLLVIHTAIGAAQRVALALDRAGWPEMIGNIGGDDTVFVATASAGRQQALMRRLAGILGR